jgi:S-formylglutathione hydrolase FrmB
MRNVTLRSASLEREVTYRVYAPAEIPAGTKLAVVYLLHGNGGGIRDWSNWSDAGKYATKDLILVMPDGDSSYWMNERLAPKEKYEDYFIKDLVPDVESRFPARNDREGRAIIGVSMGGFAAVRLSLARPDLFGFAGAISPSIDAPSRRFSMRRWGQSMRFRTIFGPYGSAERRTSDPFVMVKTADPEKTPYIYITAGRDEPLREPIERFARQLKERKLAYEFHELPGAHDWRQWDAQIPGCFDSMMRTIHPPGASLGPGSRKQ